MMARETSMDEKAITAESAARMADALERGYTLTAEWYTDPAIYALEQRRVFRSSWQYVEMTDQLARPGDFITATIGVVPIIVTRGQDSELRAFANVCRHRGAQVERDACGNRKTLQCHYHAWTYNLDGSLRAAPGMKDEPGFDTSAYPLRQLRLDTWGPFIFVNLDANARPLSHYLGELPALVDATGLRLDGIHRRVRRTYEIAANWKVVMDNYLECYHCPVAHPSFTDLIDLDKYVVTEYDYFSTQAGPARASARAGKSDLYDLRGGVEAGFYAYLWPNFTINIYPGLGNVSLNLIVPVDEHHTVAVYEYCFADAVSEQEEHDFVRFIDQVQEEDIVLCESVQRGLRSGYYDQGKLMMRREHALRHFQRLVHRELTTL
jgi:phenylpropionate dioxygenase-like ring-hydroxylating dioxygenase large terminal subunit